LIRMTRGQEVEENNVAAKPQSKPVEVAAAKKPSDNAPLRIELLNLRKLLPPKIWI